MGIIAGILIGILVLIGLVIVGVLALSIVTVAVFIDDLIIIFGVVLLVKIILKIFKR